MTANPLSLVHTRAGKVTVEMLEELAASLNASHFVKDQGWHYFVKRSADGSQTLERQEGAAPTRPFRYEGPAKPWPSEEAIIAYAKATNRARSRHPA